jgi:ribosomal protein S16
MATQLTLGDFVKQLAVRLESEKIAMMFDDETPWHLLFYRLFKEQTGNDRPALLNKLTFDWDGPTPKCPQLSDYLRALHVIGSVGVVNPSFETIDINPEMRAMWQRAGEGLSEDARKFLTHAVEIAKEEFRQTAVA